MPCGREKSTRGASVRPRALWEGEQNPAAGAGVDPLVRFGSRFER